MIEGRDYLLVENDLQDDYFSIQLATKPYAGVVYKYGNVRLREEDDRARLSFDYKIESVPEHLLSENLKAKTDFTNLLGDILADILSNSDAQIGNGQPRSTNTK